MKKIIAEIEQTFNKIISIGIVKRIVKASDYVWKRIRKSLKSKRDEEKFRECKEELKEWQEMEQRKEVDLYYFDEREVSIDFCK